MSHNIQKFSSCINHARIEITASNVHDGFKAFQAIIESKHKILFTFNSADIFTPLSILTENLATELIQTIQFLSSNKPGDRYNSVAEKSGIIDTISAIGVLETLLCDFVMKG